MNSIEFGKMCRPYNKKYREIFGGVPCKEDYACSQEEFLDALKKSIDTGKEISTYLRKHNYDNMDPNVKT